jgi:hypothetical protein
MLQHDSNAKYRTPAVTEALIKYYKSKGCTFYGLDHYYGEELCFKKKNAKKDRSTLTPSLGEKWTCQGI